MIFSGCLFYLFAVSLDKRFLSTCYRILCWNTDEYDPVPCPQGSYSLVGKEDLHEIIVVQYGIYVLVECHDCRMSCTGNYGKHRMQDGRILNSLGDLEWHQEQFKCHLTGLKGQRTVCQDKGGWRQQLFITVDSSKNGTGFLQKTF